MEMTYEEVWNNRLFLVIIDYLN